MIYGLFAATRNPWGTYVILLVISTYKGIYVPRMRASIYIIYCIFAATRNPWGAYVILLVISAYMYHNTENKKRRK